MKVLLINPVSADIRDVRKKCLPPYNLLCLGTALKKAGFMVELIDANSLVLSDEEVIKRVDEYKPDLIGLPVLTEILKNAYSLIGAIKRRYTDAKILIGGAHVSVKGKDVFSEFSMVDFALCGEADESIVELCRAIENKKDLSCVKGLIYKNNGSVIVNESSKAPEVFDIPDYSLLDEAYDKGNYYMIQMGQHKVASLITSRGCPYSCGFCGNIRGKFRPRSAENVIEELHAIKAKGIKLVDIVDTNFNLDRSRAMKIFDLMIKEKLGISFRFKSRVDIIDEEQVRKSKEAGCHLISYGMESGSQYILDRMEKGTTIEQNVKACEITKRAGLLCHAGWCVGYPGETPETIEETTSFIIKIKPTTASITPLMPYPGTRAYNFAKTTNTLVGEWNIKSNERPWVKLPWLSSKGELEKIVQRMKTRVYYRPFYIKNFAGQIIRNLDLNLGRYAFHEVLKTTGVIR